MTAAITEEFGRIPMSPFLKATLARAADYASAQMHREVTLEHLLLALAEDPEASIVLKSSQIDIQRLMADVSTYLGRIDDRVEGAAQAGGAISGDLRRILEASAAAASQGRRREINGAIVLAAIVGDGKSPAAHMLRSQGLTFEQAIRALQQAASAPAAQNPARPSPAGSAPAPRATTTDDIMASARERVLTRTGPPEQPVERTQPPRPPEPRVAVAAPEPALTMPPAPPIPGPRVAPIDPMAGRMGQKFDPSPRADAPRAPDGQPAVGNVPYPQASQVSRAPSLATTPTPAVPSQADTAPAQAPPLQERDSSTLTLPGTLPGSFGGQEAPVNQGPGQVQGLGQGPGPSWAPSAPPRQNPSPPANGLRPSASGSATLPPPFPPPRQAGAVPPPHPAGFGPGFNGPNLQPPQARPPAPPQPAPWAEAGAHQGGQFGGPMGGGQPGQRSPHYDDAMARLDARRPQAPGAQQSGQGQPQRHAGSAPMVQAGQLVENIPRKMRVGIPVIVEARIARANVKALSDGLQGDGAVYRHEVTVTKAMSVRLRAPDGGFWVETASPETQWIENVLGLMSNDYASWRWSVTPQLRGKRKLQLVISARTVGTDGLTAETALPDQVIDVAVGINIARTLAKWGTWAAAAIAGGLLSHFGETIVTFAKSMLSGNA